MCSRAIPSNNDIFLCTNCRERNREHAKKSRIRKRLLLDLLQDQLTALRGKLVINKL